jgi:starch-binding outer membrane protein, SusD/RagB family
VVPQAAPDSVYSLVFRDLKYAIEHIPANAYPKKDAATNDGHITKYGAEAILARAYLFYSGYYGKEPDQLGLTKADALAACEDIIASGEFSLVPRFRDLWPASADDKSGDHVGLWAHENSSWAGPGNPETILSMKFNYTADYNGNNDGNRFQVMIGMRTGSLVYEGYGQGWGGCTVTPSIASAYATGDTRRSASIIDASQLKDYEDTYLADQREYTGYFVKKYTPLSKHETAGDGKLQHYTETVGAGDFQISQFQDWVLVRYADVPNCGAVPHPRR